MKKKVRKEKGKVYEREKKKTFWCIIGQLAFRTLLGDEIENRILVFPTEP